jgi:hypothetical protein
MSQENVNSIMTEESVVSHVADLMETLDHVREYNELYRSLKKFFLLVISSIVIFLAIGASLNFANLAPSQPAVFVISGLLLFIPIIGVVIGVLFIRKRLNSIKQGEWRTELSNGFPGALKILSEINWDQTLDEISSGRYSYALYGLLKAFAYWIILSFAVAPISSVVSILVLHRVGFGGFPIISLISLGIVYLLLRKDLKSRLNEIRALDKLLWELRWFSLELRNAEF